MHGIRNILLIFTLLLLALRIFPQSVPYLRCLQTAPGQVTLSWVSPVNAGNFTSYNIWHEGTGSPGIFTFVTSITNYGINSFTHVLPGASQEKQRYFLITDVISGSPISSDTLSTMLLDAEDQGNGLIQLSWNKQHNPELPSWNGNYYILVEYPQGNWQITGLSNTNSYTYEITVCDDSLTFRVEAPDASGCTSVSGIAGGHYRDNRKPPMPVIDSVSVNTSSGKATLGWQVNPAMDTEGYLVYRYINNNWIIIDTVWGRSATFYEDPGSFPCILPESFALAAFDSCGNKSLGTFLEPQNTLIIESFNYNPCDLSVNISWNTYQNMQGLLAGYQILVSRDGAPFYLSGTTGAGSNSFLVQNLVPDASYRILVRAFSSGSQSTSSSCFLEIYTKQYKQPSYNYLANASVINGNQVRLTCFTDTAATVNSVLILRYDEDAGQFLEIGTIEPVSSDLSYYEDITALASQTSYIYETRVVDSCSKQILTSNLFRTIFLKATLEGTRQVNLDWSHVEGLAGGIEHYEVYRQTEDQPADIPIAILPAGTHTYEDDITEVSGSFSYQVAAKEGNTNPWGLSETVWSNEAFVNAPPQLYFPNAFRPGGINGVFRPVGIFINQTDYRLRIYNRWGEPVFESESFTRGWDGDYKGKTAPTGVYVYHVTYHDAQGRFYEEKGSFVLVR